ncbi:hypothetical protein NOC27_2611 [Nitrosococcus oceani AFC27]|nr:hypothetical protein NOC27_2611 [Nitrosococcus oceani AFC27]
MTESRSRQIGDSGVSFSWVPQKNTSRLTSK